MNVTKNDRLLYVDQNGTIINVTVMAPENRGTINVKFENGNTADISEMMLFRSQAAANVAAVNRCCLPSTSIQSRRGSLTSSGQHNKPLGTERKVK